MQKEDKYNMPEYVTEDDVLKIFLKDICGKEEVWISRKYPQIIEVNCRITDDRISDSELLSYGFEKNEYGEVSGEKIIHETEGLYTESPVIEINDLEIFKKTLYEYVKAYCNTPILWTYPQLAEDWESAAMYTMQTIWTDATRQDFENPISFLNRYKSFLTQDQWSTLQAPKKIGNIGKMQLFCKVYESGEERETPYSYVVYAEDDSKERIYFHTILFGIEDDKAYVYAIHDLNSNQRTNFKKTQQEHHVVTSESDTLDVIKKYLNGIRGETNRKENNKKDRRVWEKPHPMTIATLLYFMKEAKERGIKQVIMPDEYVMQYTIISKQLGIKIENYFLNTKTKICNKYGESLMQKEGKANDFIKQVWSLSLDRAPKNPITQEELDELEQDCISTIDEWHYFSDEEKELVKNRILQFREEHERKERDHGSSNRRLFALSDISTDYSNSNDVLLQIPGETSDFFVIDVSKLNFNDLDISQKQNNGFEEER